MNLVYGQDHLITKWVCARLKIPDPNFFFPSTAIGIEENGIIRGGVVYNNFHKDHEGKPLSIEISGASLDKRCALRHIIKPLFEYPFSQLRVRRIQFTIAKPNMVARRFAERLGFTLEGIARKAHHSGKDAAIYSLLRDECRWINELQQPFNSSSPGSPFSSGYGSSANTKQRTNCAL